MGTGNEFYSEEDVQTILRIASQTSNQSGLSRDQLLQMASEIGLSPEAVERAESQLAKVKAEEAARTTEAQDRLTYRKQKLGEVRGHVLSYVAVNLGLVVTWLATSGPNIHDFWPIWPIAGWGIGVFSHLASVFNKSAFEDGFQTWRRDRMLLETGREMMGQRAAETSLPPTDGFLAQMAQSGVHNKIEAIKMYRHVTGCDLMTAKQVVEDYMSRYPQVFSR